MQFHVEDETLGECVLESLRLKSGDHLLKLNGSVLTAQSEATHWLPVQVIDPNTFKLLNGSPEERRQFLDWGVFHVEQKFLNHWKRSEEHTSELQSRPHLVCRLLLEK